MRALKGKRWFKVLSLTATLVLLPVAALAAIGSFSSATSTPAVTGKNTSAGTGGKGVYGVSTSTAAGTRYGVVGGASGVSGIGVWGAGSKYGVFSNGPLGVATGKSLLCSSCVSATDLAVKPPKTGNVISNDTSAAIGTSCGAIDSITFVAPHAGTVLIFADFTVLTSHTNGTLDESDYKVSTTSASCDISGSEIAYDTFTQLPAAFPTASYFTPLHMTVPFAVSAGSHTFYLNGAAPFGGSATHWRDNLNAIFISS